MEKSAIIDAYYRGLLSKEECTKILGVDPTYLIESESGDSLDNINIMQ